MDSDNKKRSFEEYSGNEEYAEGDRSPKMTKRSHKKHRGAKKRSTEAARQSEVSNKPGLHFAQHRLNSSVKLNDLRDLILYCLADGVAPSWISVQNKNQFRKAVVLLVPGLEKAMFDGTLQLVLEKDDTATDPTNHKSSQDTSNGTGNGEVDWTTVGRNKSNTDPDNYLPMSLSEEKLPSPLKILATIFQDLWPIRAAGDDRYSKVHSPLHSMLQRSVQNSPEDKSKQRNIKGPKLVRVKDDFPVKKTPITQFIATVEELRNNGYVVHPALLLDDSDRQQELQRRERQVPESITGWKDSNFESTSERAKVDTDDITADNLTEGRTIYAVDCEMCIVGDEEYALTRISVLSWDGTIIMDELVKPEKPIVNYLTQ